MVNKNNNIREPILVDSHGILNGEYIIALALFGAPTLAIPLDLDIGDTIGHTF